MRFAIVTPTLNAGSLLRETVESVLATLGPEDRYAIVDGGSTDGSIDAVRNLLPPNARILRDRGGGMYDAIALGFQETPGPLMAWINASDVLLRGGLNLAEQVLRERNADLIYCDDLVIDAHGLVVRRTAGSVPAPREAMRTVGWTPLQDSCFWTRELYDRCGGVDPSWRLAGDFDFFLRAFHAGMAIHVPGVVSAFRVHPGQLSRHRSREYRAERRRVRDQFAARHPALRDGPIATLRRRAELSWRARLQRSTAPTPFIQRHWSEVPATLA